MPAPKGNKYAVGGKGGGRPKGSANQATIEFKDAVNKLIDYATPQMVSWLSEIEDPSKRLDHIYKFAQFGYPLLSRQTQAGDPDSPVVHHHVGDLDLIRKYAKKLEEK